MSTRIEWTEETWNPVTGCDRCSPGCDNCYALTLAKRLKAMGNPKYQTDGDPRTSGPGFGVQCHPDALDVPYRWRRPRRVFVNSMSDLFHPDVPDHFIARVFSTMALNRQHTFQVLTKRPQRMAALLDEVEISPHGATTWKMTDQDGRSVMTAGRWPIPNVWLGVTIESDRYTWRADHLRQTPAAVRFISAEPLLGPLPSLDLTGIDWLIAGGESGAGARPMDPDWVRDLRDRCGECGWCTGDDPTAPECLRPCATAFFFKQWGGRTPKANGRELDGRTWDEYPSVSQGRPPSTPASTRQHDEYDTRLDPGSPRAHARVAADPADQAGHGGRSAGEGES